VKEFVDVEFGFELEDTDCWVLKDAGSEVVLNDAIVLVDVVAGMDNEGCLDTSGLESSSTVKGGVSKIW
jgi:hypothetical protein